MHKITVLDRDHGLALPEFLYPCGNSNGCVMLELLKLYQPNQWQQSEKLWVINCKLQLILYIPQGKKYDYIWLH